MLLDKLSFVSRTKLKFAKAVAPIKQTSVTTFKQVDFELSVPKTDSILNFEIPISKIGNSKLTDLLTSTTISTDNFTLFSNSTIENYFQSDLIEPKIFDYSDYDELLNPDVEIENIEFRFDKQSIKGKNYVHKKEVEQPNLFSGTEEEFNSSPRPNKPKIERQYTEKNKHDEFDVFDLIFPALQPPLGNNFDNPLVLFKKLRPFQPDGVDFLIKNKSALLGDEMGLGKSVQTIIALKVLFSKGEITSCCIVCKKSMLRDWRNSFWDWAPELKVITIEGNKEERKILWSTSAHIYITNYDILQKDLDETIQIKNLEVTEIGHEMNCPNNNCKKEFYIPYKFHYTINRCPFCEYKFYYPFTGDIAKTFFDVIVFDEIQETKNPSAKKTKAARTLYSKYKWALTGTPLENKIEDLITICETIKPKLFTDTNMSSYQEIIDTYKPIFKRRRKQDVLKDLAPIESNYEWLELSSSQRRKYDVAEREGKIDLQGKGDTVTVQHIFALISKLKQICNFDPESGESCKLEYLKEKLEELTTQGDKALVFSQFPNKTLDLILPLLAEFKPLYYHGQLSNDEREKIVKKFQDEKNIENKVMLLSLKSGNSGITLTQANYVFHFDLWWNPAISAQATARTHRIGQEKTVFETMLLTEDTIEKRIFDILESKKNLFNIIVDDLSDTDNLEKLFTEEEIFGLFGLKKNRLQTRPRNEKISKEFHSLDPFEFEHFVEELFSQMGYYARTTKKTNDGGVDIYAKLKTPTGIDEVIIQCKHKENPSSTVDVGKMRELFGVLSDNKKLTKAIIVTNGRFTKGAIDFAERNRIEWIDGVKLQGYVELHL